MAILFESGMDAMHMLGMVKAAKRFGIANEFIAYPRTGHAIVIPSLEREAAQRNLDWFLFWLREEERADPTIDAQYYRWRAMRSTVVQPANSASLGH